MAPISINIAERSIISPKSKFLGFTVLRVLREIPKNRISMQYAYKSSTEKIERVKVAPLLGDISHPIPAVPKPTRASARVAAT